jgi:glutamate-1-semialdehyde 2,1-aminomutase
VRFCGAYHGWWGDVQPGVGNPTAMPTTYTLRTCTPTLRVLRRRNDIACVLVNPLQALHPNARIRARGFRWSTAAARAGFDRAAYSAVAAARARGLQTSAASC